MTDLELLKVRRNVRLVLGVALTVSVAANVAAAEPTVMGRSVAAWPPVALMLTIDVLSRAPLPGGWTGRAATVGTAVVAGVAALASFSHVRHVALEVGESELVAWLLPLSVDGLAVVCSGALVEINRRTTTAPTREQPPATDPLAADRDGNGATATGPLLAGLSQGLAPTGVGNNKQKSLVLNGASKHNTQRTTK